MSSTLFSIGRRRFGPLLLLLFCGAVAAPAQAHDGVLHALGGFGAGFAHPFSGLDHVLAMLGVGLWAGQQGGAARWRLPLAFVAAMLLGAALALIGVHLPGVEASIVASVLVLGLLIAAARHVPPAAGIALVALSAVFHGHAHGLEMPAMQTAAAYGAGFLAATALLHALGVALALVAQRRTAWIRYAGAMIAIGGAAVSLL